MYRALVFATLVLTSYAVPQAVTSIIEPSGTAPMGCQPTYNGKFGISMDTIDTDSDSKVGVGKEGISKEQVSKEAAGTHTSALVAWSDNSTTFHDHPVVFNYLETRMTEDIEATGNASSTAVVPNCVNATAGVLILTLEDGVMHDSLGRTAYIAGNFQWQFDEPPQAGAISTAGYSVCGNNSVALGSSAVWYQCKSGNFYNIYDRHWAPQCEMSLMELVPLCGA